jgi:hypothetical protein
MKDLRRPVLLCSKIATALQTQGDCRPEPEIGSKPSGTVKMNLASFYRLQAKRAGRSS